VRTIEVEEGLRVRFPGRGASFADGVEIGILLAHLGERQPVIAQTISCGNAEQARVLAAKFGYRLTLEAAGADSMRITLTAQALRPRLRIVSSA